MDLQHTNILVTGAAGGIGTALVAPLQHAGAAMVYAGDAMTGLLTLGERGEAVHA